MTASKKHISRRAWCPWEGWQNVRYVSERREEVSLGSKIMSAIRLQSLIILEDIDKDERRSDQNELVRLHKPDMQNRLIQRLFSLNYFVLSCTVVYPESKTD